MINYDVFLEWINKFKPIISNDEHKINSVFCEDTKHHLWCNPHKNTYHCWKSNESGNLFRLVSIIDKIPYDEAKSFLESDQNNIRLLEKKLNKYFKTEKEIIFPKNIQLPPKTYLISKLPEGSRAKIKAMNYLKERKISSDGLYYCLEGEYGNRIIIPYYNKNKEVIYWNGRHIGDSPLRYFGPKNCGVGKGDVIFATKWDCDKVYLTEGEFDAMSLNMVGYAGWACGGKELSDKQINYLRNYKICLALDQDKYGQIALNKMGNKLLKEGIRRISYVSPPIEYKDWNKMFIELGKSGVHDYILSKEQIFKWTTEIKLSLGKI